VRLLAGLLAIPLLLSASTASGLRAYDRGDFATAARDWSQDAAAGDREAMYHLGLLYRDGEGVSRDPSKAMEWLARSARQGFSRAQTEYARFLAEGLAGPPDYAQARDWYRKAIAQDNHLAMNELGLLYMNGLGGPVDYAEAMVWFTRAARYSAPAMSNMALLYEMGWGTPKNLVEACALYTVAAERGSKNAPGERDAVCGELDGRSGKLANGRITSLHLQRAGYWVADEGIYWVAFVRNLFVFIYGIVWLFCYFRGVRHTPEAKVRYREISGSRFRRWFLFYRPRGVLAWMLHLCFHVILAAALVAGVALMALPFDFGTVALAGTMLLILALFRAVAVWRDHHTLDFQATSSVAGR
jgi:TPR repeat protein